MIVVHCTSVAQSEKLIRLLKYVKIATRLDSLEHIRVVVEKKSTRQIPLVMHVPLLEYFVAICKLL